MERQAPGTRGLAGGADVVTATRLPAATARQTLASGLACLVLIARRAGLTIDGNRLAEAAGSAEEPDLATLATCATAAGFRAQALTLDWRHLQDLGRALPAIVVFRDGRRLVLTRIAAQGATPEVTLVDPGDPEREATMLRAAFELAWTGETVLLKRMAAPATGERLTGWGTLLTAALGDRRLLMDLGLSTVVLAALASLPILGVRALLGDVMTADARGTLAFVITGLAALIVFEAAFAILRGHLVTRLAGACGQRLNATVLARVLRMPASAHERAPLGEATRRLGHIDALDGVMTDLLPPALMDGAVSVMLIPLMLWFSVPLTILVAVLASGAVGVSVLLSGRDQRAAAALRAAEDEAAGVLAETSAHRDAVLALGLEARQRRRWDVVVARVTRARLADAAASGALDTVAAATEGTIRYAPIVLGIVLAMNRATPGALADLFAFTLAAWRFAHPLRELGPRLRGWAAGRAAVEDVAAWSDMPGLPEPAEAAPAMAWAGQVGFKDVGFTYSDAAVPTLRAVSFTVDAGSMVGVVGRSGAGKSTLAGLLGRQLAGGEGLIKIDGIDVRAIPVDQLCRAVAVVRGGAAWFAGTLRDNLSAADPDVSDDTLQDVLRLTGAAGVVEALPHGLATVLDDASGMFSDGERQRLAIARALLGRPAVLVLDNAASALDAPAEARLLGDLKAVGRLTTIAVTHRLTSLSQADAVLVLDGGEIEDMGHHRDLILRSDLYNGLWQRRLPRGPGVDALPLPSARAA